MSAHSLTDTVAVVNGYDLKIAVNKNHNSAQIFQGSTPTQRNNIIRFSFAEAIELAEKLQKLTKDK